MVFMANRCGAWQVGDDIDGGPVEFRILFPHGADPQVTAIRVAGDFQHHLGGQDWDFAGGPVLTVEQRTGDQPGTFWSVRTGDLPAGFHLYKYLVEFDDGAGGRFTRIVTDPCARYGGGEHANSGVVVGGSRPADNVVRPLVGGRRPLEELTVYELMIDDFTSEYRRGRAPLDAVVDRLDDLRGAGFTAIEFMPWTAWKTAEFDWGYEPYQYFSVETRYADDVLGPAEKLSRLKRLISECHDRGIHVIMDGVFNHVSVEFPYRHLYRNPDDCPFTRRTFVKAFPGLQDLDFAEPITGELVRDVCRYWIEVFGIDGIRFDNTVNFYAPGDLRGLPEILASVRDLIHDRGEDNFSLTLEHLDVSAVTVTNTTAATSYWDDSLHQRTWDALWSGGIDSSFLNALNTRRFLADGKVPTLYLSNHDHSHVAWRAARREGDAGRRDAGAFSGWWRVQPFLIALFTSTAVPLVPNGQEFGEEHRLPEDDQGSGRRVSARPLHWKQRTDRIGAPTLALHTRLARLREQHPAMRSALMYPHEWQPWQTRFNPVGVGVDVERQLVIHHRWAPVAGGVENLVVVLNFSEADQQVEVPFPTSGRWDDLLAGFDGGPGYSVGVAGPRAMVDVGSHWGRILHRVNPA